MATSKSFILVSFVVFSIDQEDRLMAARHRHREGNIPLHSCLLLCWNILLEDRNSERIADPSQPKTRCNPPSQLDFPCMIDKKDIHAQVVLSIQVTFFLIKMFCATH